MGALISFLVLLVHTLPITEEAKDTNTHTQIESITIELKATINSKLPYARLMIS